MRLIIIDQTLGEEYKPIGLNMILLGAGQVGKALAKIAEPAGCTSQRIVVPHGLAGGSLQFFLPQTCSQKIFFCYNGQEAKFILSFGTGGPGGR